MRNYLVGVYEHHFCNENCRKEWYSKEWSQRDEWREECSKRSVRMLENNQFQKTDTSPQLKVNTILEELNINYKNEYNCEFYAIDNALIYNDKIFFIEVMGGFWHCDTRDYKTILYGQQHNRIVVDRAKKTYIENKYNTKILYLWESDINNLELCKNLIIEFINKNLKYYHSSDYILKDNKLLSNKNKIEQYIEHDASYVKERIDFVEKGRIRPQTQRQPDKWITYNCELCGKEKEMLKSHYKKAKHHYCSHECRIKSMRKAT